MKYTGEKCSACGEVFTDNDDVVVCPECGTPQHRECYRMNGECVNQVRHGDFRWKSTVNAAPPTEVSEDTTENTDNTANPEVRRIEVKSFEEFIEENMKVLDKEEKDGCSFREVLDFVHNNVLYYMPVFTGIRNFGKKISFNLSCFLFPQLQFAYRKMWFWAIFTSVLSIILIIPMMISLIVSNTGVMPTRVVEAVNSNADLVNTLMEICNGADLLMRLLLCLFGNRLYYKFTVKSIRRMKKDGRSITKEQLVSAGGVRISNIILMSLITFALTFGTMSILMLVLPMIF